jgi:uncharacterized protein
MYRSDGHGTPVQLEEKGVSESADAWTVRGYAAVFNNKDLGGDVILPGAFADSLQTHGLPLILFQHKVDDVPVGTCTEAKEDRRGLLITAELPKDDEFVRGRLVPQLKRRGLKGMSIGYRALETEKRKEDNGRLLKRIRLYECSFVSMPMNPQAGVETIKDMTPSQLADALEQMQRALNAFREELQPDRVRQIREAMKAMQAFADEIKRTVQVRHPNIRDPMCARNRRCCSCSPPGVHSPRHDEVGAMGSMTNVALATPAAGGPNWTLVYTAGAAGTVSIHNRTPDSDVLLRLNGSAGLATGPLGAPAELLHPFATVALTVANGDLVFARLINPGLNPGSTGGPITGRVTVRI